MLYQFNTSIKHYSIVSRTRTEISFIDCLILITWLSILTPNTDPKKKKLNCSHIHVMLIATVAYIICIVGIIMMYIWYTPDPTCLLNIFFITWTLVLLQLMTSVSLHPKVSPLPSVHSCANMNKKLSCLFLSETDKFRLLGSGAYGALYHISLLVCH